MFAGTSFYFCDMTEANSGYNSNYDVKIMEASKILASQELKTQLKDKKCESEKDCVHSEHCTTLCDKKTHSCGEDILRPNLHLVCRMIVEYILEDSPEDVYRELVGLLDRCDKLSYLNNTNTDIEHSLVLNDLKSLLWKEMQ